MFKKVLLGISFFLLCSFQSTTNAIYTRTFFDSGKIKSEGWLKNGIKTAFWKMYHKNGKVASEGHFKNNRKSKYWHYFNEQGQLVQEGHYAYGKKNNWWLFYDKNGFVNHKCQLKNNVKNGYCLKYKNQKLTSAEKYENGKKINEWFSFGSFKRDNNLAKLK
ncbi:toxin-antitoxin system YwqK family antitoxin [Euzebyella saccharophila]|uniref:Toxin-antitoxin system YwqK family antitoxin n=1 Tax=Euzebyella saccharophila TaxID=679664 RepID=A0ABV8JM14_9FLAO|nr:hypothetical protein [Euzebyella saccharophila]